MPSDPGLSQLQLDLLQGFSARCPEFYLTGGAALIGFHGFQRHTDDLDMFTLGPGPTAKAGRELERTAEELGATCTVLRAATDYRRYLVQRPPEATTVDLVREQVAQVAPTKPRLGGVLVDPPEEILANKLCTLVSRSEVRDLWDVYHLVLRGLSLDEALEGAHRKDAGVTVETLIWLLTDLRWPALTRLAEKAAPVNRLC